MRTPGLAVIALAAALAAGDAHARVYRPVPPPPVSDVGAELGAAIRAKDVAGVSRLLFDPLYNYGVWFSDPACAKQFGAPGVVVGDERTAFARCLTQLKLLATTRQPGAGDNGIVTYDPGVELELVHADGRVRWIGFQYQTEADQGRPTLTAQAFEALRQAGSPNVDAAVRAVLEPLLERTKTTAVSAWLKICLDEKGAIDRVAVRQSAGPEAESAAVKAAFEAAVRGWKFRAFQVRGKPQAACAMTLLTYPMARGPLVETLPAAVKPPLALARPAAAKAPLVDLVQPVRIKRIVEDDDEVEGVEGGVVGGVVGGGVWGPPPPPPPPPAPSQIVAPTVLEQLRTRGSRDIPPDPVTKTEIARSGVAQVVGSFKLCVDARGAVTTVTQLKSTGFGSYDARLLREIRTWAFSPYRVNGAAVPACTAATFVYKVPATP